MKKRVVEMFLGSIGETPVLFSDAIGFDQRWLDLLFDAAGFRFAPILRSAPALSYRETVEIFEPVHRAGPDAFALARQLSRLT